MIIRLLAAAPAPAIEKIKHIPPAFWWKMGLAIAIFVAAIILLRKVARMNKVVLTIIVLIVMSTIGFNWIYQRNEPAWATPVVEKLAGFFPTKGAYANKQRENPH
jgi:hypothetical protein